MKCFFAIFLMLGLLFSSFSSKTQDEPKNEKKGISYYVDQVKKYGISAFSFLKSKYEESAWPLTVAKLLFDGWLIKNSGKLGYRKIVDSLEEGSRAARLIKSVFNLDAHIFSILRSGSTVGDCTDGKRIYLSEETFNNLQSFSEDRQYQALGVIAHEQRHYERHFSRLIPGIVVPGILLTNVALRTLFLNKVRPLAETLYQYVVKKYQKYKKPDRKKPLKLRKLKAGGILVGSIMTLALMFRNQISEVSEGFNAIIYAPIRRTIGRYMENDADAIKHNNPLIEYKLHRGLQDFFKNHEQKLLESLGSLAKIEIFLRSLLDEHAPYSDRIAAAQSRMDGLYNTHASIRRFEWKNYFKSYLPFYK